MTCNEIRELMPDLAAGLGSMTPELNTHIQSCDGCAGKLAELQQTMALLDEWQSPEPSPYFDVRLRARLREEMAKANQVWFRWIRKPALALALSVLLVMSVTLLHLRTHTKEFAGNEPPMVLTVEPGTAVGDLQALDKNNELYSDFDVLDDLQVQADVNANP